MQGRPERPKISLEESIIKNNLDEIDKELDQVLIDMHADMSGLILTINLRKYFIDVVGKKEVKKSIDESWHEFKDSHEKVENCILKYEKVLNNSNANLVEKKQRQKTIGKAKVSLAESKASVDFYRKKLHTPPRPLTKPFRHTNSTSDIPSFNEEHSSDLHAAGFFYHANSAPSLTTRQSHTSLEGSHSFVNNRKGKK